MKKYLRKHLKLIIVLSIFIAIVISGFIAYNLVFVNNSSKYGNRLDGIQNVKLTNNKKNLIKSNIKTLEITKSINITLSGKIINIIAVVNDDTETSKAKEIGGKVLEQLTDEQKKFYDVQIFIKKNNKDEKFPIIGYKHHNNENIKWTADR
ncbi:MAG: hypothetical protein IKO49_06145 [Bacilli bacterium]|nr:hypothetical protein [Bacilli bacterium]